MGFNVRSLYNNDTTNATTGTKKKSFNVVSVADKEYELTSGNRNFGTISYGAKKAIEGKTLDSYTPKNDAEKSVLDSYKEHRLDMATANKRKNYTHENIYSRVEELKKIKPEEYEYDGRYDANLEADALAMAYTESQLSEIAQRSKNKKNVLESPAHAVANFVSQPASAVLGGKAYMANEERIAKDKADRAKKISDVDATLSVAESAKQTKSKMYDTTYAEAKDDIGTWAIKQVDAGAEQFNRGLMASLDFVLPTEFLGRYDIISNLNEQHAKGLEHYQSEAHKSSASRGKGWKTAGDILSGTIAAAPNAVLAYVTAGYSLGTTGTIGGTQSAASMGGMLKNAVKEMFKNPAYYTSFLQTFGMDYEEAKEQGANEFVASSYAILASAVNAGIEIGGGVEKLANELKSEGTKAFSKSLLNWIKSSVEEGGEEVVQGIVSNATAKMLFNHGAPIGSFTDDTAVFNPVKSAKEFAMGTAVGGILGGAQTTVTSAVNATQNAVAKHNIAKTGNLYNNPEAIAALVETGLESPKDTQAYMIAEELSKKKGTPSDYKVGQLFYANVAQLEAEEKADKSEIVRENKESNTAEDAVSVGAVFVSADGSKRFEIVSRDNSNTVIKATEGDKELTRTFKNSDADRIITNTQFKKLGDSNEEFTSNSEVEAVVAEATKEKAEVPTITETVATEKALPEYVYADADGIIRFKQSDIDYSDNTMREGKFYIRNAKASSAEVEGFIVGKYAVHQEKTGKYAVTHLQSGTRMAQAESLDKAQKLAKYLNDNVAFNNVSYAEVDGKGLVPVSTAEVKQFAAEVKRIVAEKPYLVETVEAVEDEVQAEENVEDMYALLEKLGLTEDERYAILEYKSSFSYHVNAKLRKGILLEEYEENLLRAANHALDKFPKYEGTVYRNIGFYSVEEFEKCISQHKIGETITYPHFTSTSKLIDGYLVDMKYTIHFEWECTSGADVDKVGIKEGEVLYKSGSTFRVVNVSVDGKIANIVLQEELENEVADPEYDKRNERSIDKGSGEAQHAEEHTGVFSGTSAVRGRGIADDRVSEEQSRSDRERSDKQSGRDNSDNDKETGNDGVTEGQTVSDDLIPKSITYNSIELVLSETKDTRDDSPLYVLKPTKRISEEEFNGIRDAVKAQGGFYSRFLKQFAFKDKAKYIEFVNSATPNAENSSEVKEEAVEAPEDNEVVSEKEKTTEESVEVKKGMPETQLKEEENATSERTNIERAIEAVVGEEKVDAVYDTFLKSRLEGWESNAIKQRKIKRAIYEVLGNEEQTEKVFDVISNTDTKSEAVNDEGSEVLDSESGGHAERGKSESVQKVEEDGSTLGNDGNDGEVGADSLRDDDGTAEEHESPQDKGSKRDSDGELGERNDSEGSSGTETVVSDRSDREVKEKRNTRNFILSNEIDDARPNASDNIEAVKLLKELEESGRVPTKAEKEILAKYKGWGGLKEAFMPTTYMNRQIQGIFTEEEFKAAKATINDAFYTPTKVIDAIYKGLQRMGFTGGVVLEPSMGVGNFFGRMPKGISANSQLHGVEIDSITGRIASMLYPDADVKVAPFQDVNFKEGTFDLILGNVPFSEVGYRYKKGKYSLHDYFFLKSLDLLNDNGVCVFLTSTGTFDKRNITARNEIMKRADVVAAFRLPSGTFSRNAGTDVTTDLIILKKRAEGAEASGDSIENVGAIGDIAINEYYVKHPENILGKLVLESNQFGQMVPVVKREGDLDKLLAKAVKSLPKDLLTGKTALEPLEVEVSADAKPHFVEKDGRIAFVDTVLGETVEYTGKKAERARGYMMIKDKYNALLDAATKGEDTAALRKELNTIYDRYVKNFGYLQDKANNFLSDDNDFVRVSGLELYEPNEKTYTKSDIFKKDTIGYKPPTSADTATDALAISINETGDISFKRMEELTGKTKEQLVEELSDKIIQTPDGDYQLLDVYLSGNVREKLKAVEGKKGFERNEELLKTVMPKDKTASEIKPSLGAAWIPPKYIAQFIQETFETYSLPQVNYDRNTGTWMISSAWGNRQLTTKRYGTGRIDAIELVRLSLNMKSADVWDKIEDKRFKNVKETQLARQKQSEISEAFENWIFKDKARRDELCEIYNKLYNNHVNMNYESLAQYLTFPGLSENSFKLRPYQKAAVARVVFGGDTLLAHGVGTGKTAEMIASAMELKRMGIVKKNMMIVPKHKVGDFRADILKMYPESKVLMATEKDFEKKNRRKLFSKIATNDWDIIVIGHTSFNLIPVKGETQAAFIEAEIDEIEETIISARIDNDGSIDKRFLSQLEKSKKAKEEQLKELLETQKDDTLTFEEMGVDSVFVDEAHNFKNLPFYTKLNVPGVKGGVAKRAQDLFMKANYLRSKGGRVTFATATPITNSVSELYNTIRYLRPDLLKEAGIYSFDGWAATFGKIETKIEVSPDGQSFRTKERFSKFHNVPEMVGMSRIFMDVLRTADVVKNLPEAEYIDVISPASDIHEGYVAAIMERMKKISSSGQDRSDNMLLVTNDGRAMATDLRLVASQLVDYLVEDLDVPESKVNKCVKNVVEEYKKSSDGKGTQFIFLDFGIKADEEARYGYNLYEDIINKLKAAGIPESEIAKIGDYDTVAKKDALFEKVNNGEVRILIGSTAKMGEGMNAQRKAVALHHLNAPYRPSDIEQREGRIIRFGNENKNVRIYRYIQERSFDSYMWQMLARKAEFINQAMSNGDVTELEETDDFVLSAKTGMAIATGNPLIMEKVEIDEEVKRLQLLQKSYNANIYDMQDRLAKLPEQIKNVKGLIEKVRADVATIKKNTSKDFSIKIGKTTFDKRTEAGEAIELLIKKAPKNGTKVEIGTYRGMQLFFSGSVEKGYKILIKGDFEYSVDCGDSGTGNIARISNEIDRVAKFLEIKERLLTSLENELTMIREDINKPFTHQEALDNAIRKQAEINAALNMDKSDDDVSEVIEEMNDDFGEESEDEAYYSLESEDDYGRGENYDRDRGRFVGELSEGRENYDRDGERFIGELDTGRTQELFEEQRQGSNGRGTGSVSERGLGTNAAKKRSAQAEVASDGRVAYTPMASEEMTKSIHEDLDFAKKHGIKVHVAKGSVIDLIKGVKARGLNTSKTEIYYNGDKNVFGHELGHLIKRRNPKAYDALWKVVEDNISYEEFREILFKYTKALKKAYGDKASIMAEEEFICDLCGEFYEMGMKSDTVIGKAIAEYFDAIDVVEDRHADDTSYFSLATDGIADLDDLIAEYGEIEPGENPAREVHVPKKISKNRYVSRFARTMMEAEVTPDDAHSEFEARILDGTLTHEPITNDKARESAAARIKYLGFNEAVKEWEVLSRSGKVGKNELALGMELYNQCITNKDTYNAMKIAAELTAEATRAGQTLQACRMLKLMTPDGQLYYLEKSVEKMNEEFRANVGKKFKDIELDEELVREFLEAQGEEARNAAYDALCQNIADQIPPTWRDKWNSWRYLAMLGNPRTHIRNIVGNAVFTPALRMKTYIGAVLERAFKVDTANRTKSLFKTKEAVEFAKSDFKEMQSVLQGENAKYAVTNDIEGKRTIFKTRWIEALRTKNFEWLEREDIWFLKAHYVDALARLLTVRKIDTNRITPDELEKIKAIAIREAQAATYRDANALADALTKMERNINRSGNKPLKAFGFVIEGVMPFKKTPLNIAKQGVAYSPIGLLSAVYKTMKRAQNSEAYEATAIIDDLAKGLTGTMATLLGLWLASLGLLSGRDDENKKKREFDEMVGEQSYALQIGDKSYTVDWMTPSCLPLFIGVELYNLTKDELSFRDVIDATGTLTEPLLELSVFSGVSDAIATAQYSSTNELVAVLTDAVSSYFLQALPTLGGQASRIIDKDKRQYYFKDKNSELPGVLQTFIGQAASKIPFASYLFEHSVDNWGREETYGNVFERAFENTVSPGYYSEDNYTKVDYELRRLYTATGDNAVFPTTQVKYYVVGGVRYNMTAEDYTKVKTYRGKLSFKLVKELIGSSQYKKMSDEEKANAIAKCYEQAGKETKAEMLDRVKRHSRK